MCLKLSLNLDPRESLYIVIGFRTPKEVEDLKFELI